MAKQRGPLEDLAVNGEGGRGRDGFWEGRRVFVTGATGIVGSRLVRSLLERQARVTALVYEVDRQSELYRSGDIRHVSAVHGELEDHPALVKALDEHEAETVFHLGAQPIVEVAHCLPLQTFEANIRGTYNLLEACRRNSNSVSEVVVASSDKAYGEAEELPYTEETPLNGRHPYEVSKSAADMLAQSYHHTFGLAVTIARCGNVYGPGDLNWSRLVPGTIRSFLRCERPVIRSDGSFVRDYVFVDDIVRSYMGLAEHAEEDGVRGEAFNFSAESPFTVMDVVSTLAKLMDCEHLEPDVRSTARGEIRSQYLSSAKARRVLGWQPRFTLEEGLDHTIRWYREFLRGPR